MQFDDSFVISSSAFGGDILRKQRELTAKFQRYLKVVIKLLYKAHPCIIYTYMCMHICMKSNASLLLSACLVFFMYVYPIPVDLLRHAL